MSPEQICGKPVDERADVYAIAVVIYEMLTGRPPFQGDDPMTFADLDAPEGLEALVMQGLCKQVEQRILSAASFLAAIEDLCQSDWISEHTPLPAFPSISQLAVETHDLSDIRAIPTSSPTSSLRGAALALYAIQPGFVPKENT
jgi:serine/threonine protein kinase